MGTKKPGLIFMESLYSWDRHVPSLAMMLIIFHVLKPAMMLIIFHVLKPRHDAYFLFIMARPYHYPQLAW
jgi:hypothetical protein